MAISPVNVTRVSHGLRTMSMLDSLRRNTTDIFTQQARLASGRSFLSIGDDPVAATQSLKLNKTITDQAQILTNLQHANLMLASADDALSEVNNLMNDAEAIASQSIGPQSDGAEREANALVIASIRERLMTIGNRQVRDMYLFAGRDTQHPPFVSALGGVAFVGDTGNVLARVGRLDQEATNITGDSIFGALSSAIRSGKELDPNLSETTRLEDLAGANRQGIRKGSIVLSDSGGTNVAVDLSTADSVGDVMNMIEAAASDAGVSVTIAIDGNGLTVGGSGVTIRDGAGGRTASDLGIATTDGPSAAAGPVDLGPRLTTGTLLSDVNAGAGIPETAGLTITNGTNSVELDLSEAETIQDVLNQINSADIFVSARINQERTGIEIVSQVSGATLNVTDKDGETAKALGLSPFGDATPLSALNFGRGVAILEGEPDLTITARNGASFDVNLDGAETVGDVVALINQAASDAGVNVVASVDQSINGIAIEDGSGGAGSLSVGRGNIASFAVDDLGILTSVDDPEARLISEDISGVRAEGIFTSLLDLEKALNANDERAIGIVGGELAGLNADITRARGEIGARGQSILGRIEQTENAVQATQAFLSDIEELDFTEAVTQFQQAQTALQANLLSGSQLLNLSLLDFLG